jgi:hypothetical protein
VANFRDHNWRLFVITYTWWGSGMSSEDAATLILTQVRQRRFWIFTHPDLLASVSDRTQGMLEGHSPTTPRSDP